MTKIFILDSLLEDLFINSEMECLICNICKIKTTKAESDSLGTFEKG